MKTVFIDGEAGTTGLQIRERLADRSDIQLIGLAGHERKSDTRRRAMLNEADIAILCLPDAAARDAVAMIDNPDTRVIDASTAHRTAPGWVYGFPEYEATQAGRIADARRVTNPGCYALASVAMINPLCAAGILPADWPVTLNAVSGYSGGGRALITAFEDPSDPAHTATALRFYALGLDHKHIPEIMHWCGLVRRPLFTPAVGRFRQGMIVQCPLHLSALPTTPRPADVVAALRDHYAAPPGEPWLVRVATPDEGGAAMTQLEPEQAAGTDELVIRIFTDAGREQLLLVALLDNLGKGAAGQAVQNLNLMLGERAAA